jgi:hypothetical protein
MLTAGVWVRRAAVGLVAMSVATSCRTASSVAPFPIVDNSPAALRARVNGMKILSMPIPFDSGSDQLGGYAQSVLEGQLAILLLNPRVTFRVVPPLENSADSMSVRLARARSQQIATFLVARGVARERLHEFALTEPYFQTFSPDDRALTFLLLNDPSAIVAAPELVAVEVHAQSGVEVFALPRLLAQDSIRVLCNPPLAARLGVSDTNGVVTSRLRVTAVTFVVRSRGGIVTGEHDVSAEHDPDVVDLRGIPPDPACQRRTVP